MMKPYNSLARKPGSYPRLDTATGKNYPESNVWKNMHERCTQNLSYENIKNVAYLRDRVQICEEWYDYQNFAQWWHSVQYREKGWVLDKDILVKGNKLYSPDTCCFVPAHVNILFINNKINRGEFPLGVYLHPVNKNYVASVRKGSRAVEHIGSFTTPELAFYAYKKEKEAWIKEKALEYKDRLDPRVYEAMIKWEIEISD